MHLALGGKSAQVAECGRVVAFVVDYDDPVVAVGGLSQDRIDRAPQQVDPVFSGDEYRNRWAVVREVYLKDPQVSAYGEVGPRDGAGNSAPIQSLLHGVDASLKRSRLGRTTRRGRTGKCSPVVEHAWYVSHSPRLFGHPQGQIVILTAFKARAEPAYTLEQLTSYAKNMAEI